MEKNPKRTAMLQIILRITTNNNKKLTNTNRNRK